MKRTTIMLPSGLKERAQRAARERGISFGQLLREAVEDALSEDATMRPFTDPLFADAAVFEGDSPADLSVAHDAHLYGTGPEA
jgi:hypothetical protein